MTINYFISSEKKLTAIIYVKMSIAKGCCLIAPTKLSVKPSDFPQLWDNKKEIKYNLLSAENKQLNKKLADLKYHIADEYQKHYSKYGKDWNHYNKEWLNKVIIPESGNPENLNEYIVQFINDIREGKKQSIKDTKYASGSVYVFEGLKRILDEFQGLYSDKRLAQIEKLNKIRAKRGEPLKLLRPKRILDFENVNMEFYGNFTKFVSDLGYAKNTISRFIACIKIIMVKSLEDGGLHNNQQFRYKAFSGKKEKAFSIALTSDEIEKLWNVDISQSKNKWYDLAKDAWFVLYETCLRVSDYGKINPSIKVIDGKKLIELYMTKTKMKVQIPCSSRFEFLWEKYNHSLPPVGKNLVNRCIKTLARMAGLDREETFMKIEFGKPTEKTKKIWQMISCHTARRSGATLMHSEGINIETIQQLLGHSSIAQTINYIKLTDKDKEKAILKIADHPHFNKPFKHLKAV